MKLKSIDKYIIGSLIFLIIYSLYSLFIFQNKAPISNNIYTSIGKAEWIKGTTKRRSLTSSNWFEVTNSDYLFDNDYLYTGNNSYIDITFNNESQVTIGPNSLVILNALTSMPRLTLTSGNISTNNSNPIYIKETSSKNNVLVKGITSITTSKSDPLSIDLIKGSLKTDRDYNKINTTYKIGQGVTKTLPSAIQIIETSYDDKYLNIRWSDSSSDDYIVIIYDNNENVEHTLQTNDKFASLPITTKSKRVQIVTRKSSRKSLTVPIKHNRQDETTIQSNDFKIIPYLKTIYLHFLKTNSLKN